MRSTSDISAALRHDNVRLHIEYRAPDSLTAPFRKTKSHPQRQIKELAAAIERWGFLVPVTVTDDYEIVRGHAGVAAAKLLGLRQVPVIRLSHLTEAQQRLFALFDNRITAEGTIILEEVSLEIADILKLDPDTVITDSGFSYAELDAANGLTRTNELDDLADVPPPRREPTSRLGDLWRLGEHRILCGDSTDPEAIKSLVGARRVRALISDCPYNLNIPGVVSGKGRVRHDNFVMASGEMSEEQFTDFLVRFFEAAKPTLEDGALALAFMDWRHIVQLIAAGAASGLSYRQLLVWEKSSPAMGRPWRNGHELIGVFKHGDAPHVDNVQLGRFGRNRSNVLHYPGANVLTKGRRRALELHSTVKPIALIADLILDITNPGDLVLDSFGGSGTTLMAADAMGRLACLCELDPRYVDVTLERWQAKAGTEPILDATGETLSDVREDRRHGATEADNVSA